MKRPKKLIRNAVAGLLAGLSGWITSILPLAQAQAESVEEAVVTAVTLLVFGVAREVLDEVQGLVSPEAPGTEEGSS